MIAEYLWTFCNLQPKNKYIKNIAIKVDQGYKQRSLQVLLWLHAARTKKGEEREEREKEEEKSKHSKKGEKREKGKKKKREGVPRIPARNPLSQEGGDLLSRIAVQYHRRARA